MTVAQWFSGSVLQGDKYGRTLGFPTANLDPALLRHVEKEGVYACTVHLGGEYYRGALYLGPRLVLHEVTRVLEIHIIDFDQEIYGQTLEFQLGEYVRPPMNFDTTEALKEQFDKDVAAVRVATD